MSLLGTFASFPFNFISNRHGEQCQFNTSSDNQCFFFYKLKKSFTVVRVSSKL